MERVVITGPTGAIGYALINQLINEQAEIYAICRPRSKRIKGLPINPLLHVIECNLSDLEMVKEKISNKCDILYHLGWNGTFGNARDDAYIQSNNIKYTLDAVELASHLGCHTFIGAGSQAEYGISNEKLGPKTPTFPKTGYGIAKLAAGQLSRILCKKNGIRHIWIRILSIYGPHDGKHTMITAGIQKMLNGIRPQYTKAEQMWDYLYSGDAALAFCLASKKGKDGSVYCLGSGLAQPLSVYIQEIKSIVNPNIEIGFGEIPYADNQVKYLCADISNLTEDTGFLPKTRFSDGIKETVKWLKEEMNNEKN